MLNVEKELAVLRKMTAGQLKEKYAEVYGEMPRSHHRVWLIKRIIWRMQPLAEWDLSERARKRAEELANDADIRRSPPRATTVAKVSSQTKTIKIPTTRLPPPGNVITRVYKGQELEVAVKPNGFEFEGQTFKSLSAVAKKISGSHCNGYLFLRLNGSAK